MAKANIELILALRTTADRLERGADYRWTHMGSCNCGHLVQTLTRLPKAQIHRIALEKPGDWSQQAIDYCPSSGYPMDHLIETMLNIGMTLDDIRELEWLSSKAVRARLPAQDLSHRGRTDVIDYMRAWADLLEESLIKGLVKEGGARERIEDSSSRTVEDPTKILV